MSWYPKDVSEFIDKLGTEKACREYMEELRWPKGFICPRCNETKWWKTKRKLMFCAKCSYQASLHVGTIFQDTSIPLRIWFQAIWWFTNPKSGYSALGLQKTLGLGSYRTAWTMLHKLRIAMIRPGREKLSGQVEVDETYIGGYEKGKGPASASEKKQLVVIAVEFNDKKIGRIRMQRVANNTGPILQTFIKTHIEPQSTIVTDGLTSYWGIKKEGYIHKPMHRLRYWEKQPASREDDILLPRVHKVTSLLKRCYYGTYQGRIDSKYLDAYLNEFTFRFNRRTSKSRGLLFRRLLEISVSKEPIPYNVLKSDHKI
jgi:transposase-like protein